MEDNSTHVSPSSTLLDNIIPLKEENETKSGINMIQNKCELCGKILSCKKNLKKHLKLHSDERNYTCKICEKSYKRSDHLKRHMISHDPNPKFYECQLCLKRFSLNYHLTSHLQNVHGQKKLKVYKCPDCDLYFHKKSKLFFHQKDFHNLVVDKIPCYYPYCNKSYISEQKLNEHIKKYHENLIKNACNKNNGEMFAINNDDNIFGDCNEMNNSSKELCTDNSSKKFYKCPYKNCVKVYSSQYNLFIHIKTYHLKIKSFSCSLCSNKYFHKVSLKKHLMIEHKFNEEQIKLYLSKFNQREDDKEEEIIDDAKKNFEDEGLYQGIMSEKQVNESSYVSRKNSESSNERNNGEYFLEEFHKNIINEANNISFETEGAN